MKFNQLHALLFAVLSTFLFAPQAVAANVNVIVSYADWCGPCQILQPKLHSAASEFNDAIEITYLDFTDPSAENMDRQFAKAAPLAPDDFLIDGKYLKTGFAYVLISDNITRKITLLGEIFSTMPRDEIVDVFTRACREAC